MTSAEILESVLSGLKDLKPREYYETEASIYVKFGVKEFIGTLRISDHNGRARHRWNLRGDLDGCHMDIDKDCMRYYFGWKCIEEFFLRIRKYQETIKERDLCVTKSHRENAT